MSTEYEEVVTKKTKIYRALGQGIRIFHDHEFAELDILAVPGLGTDPEESWTWKESRKGDDKRDDSAERDEGGDAPFEPSNGVDSSTAGGAGDARRSFNWIRDPDGLASLFPRSRIMLYDYASAWQGSRKVRATMKSICTWLLDDLLEKRKAGAMNTRPIIFIAHSMGGVIVNPKAICMAKSWREFESLAICTMGCAFFGVPFRGSNMAKMALQYSSVFGNEAYESLLSFMRTETNDALDEVTEDFTEICRKMIPPTDLFCAWEQVPTSFDYADRLVTKTIPTLLQHKSFKFAARRLLEVGFLSDTHFVEKSSAILQGSHSVGITAGHSDLIKFESVQTEKFMAVRVAMSKMVQFAKVNIRRRTDLLGQNLINQKFMNQIRESLETVDMRLKFKSATAQQVMTSWLSSENLYQSWVSGAITGDIRSESSLLWLKGGSGLGKTKACLTAIQQVLDSQSQVHAGSAAKQRETLLAYFLCEPLAGYNKAEDVLKSIITQLINQEESLSLYAKWFIPNRQHRAAQVPQTQSENDLAASKATATVENLWKCLQDILQDPIADSVHIICSNIHYLELDDSTTTFLSRLHEHIQSLADLEPSERRVGWLITSRNDVHIRKQLTMPHVSVIDLENESEYGVQLKGARKQHARETVTKLREKKNYRSDLAYYIRNSIESQSEDERWIDTICILLEALPDDSSSLAVRKWLRDVSNCKIHQLVDLAWNTILRSNEGGRLELEELVQTLTIAYESPTVLDLAVLTEIHDSTILHDLISKCAPIIYIGSGNEAKDKVVFAHPEFSTRLAEVVHGEADVSKDQRKRFHGLMALRCFNHIKLAFTPGNEKGASASLNKATDLTRSGSVTTARLVGNTRVIEVSTEEEDAEDPNLVPNTTSSLECSYATKYFLRHLSEGFPDVVQDLCKDDPDFFISQSSKLRDSWLGDFAALTSDLNDIESTRGMSALHVAAGIGANELVSILIGQIGKSALSWQCNNGMTALHIAALTNRDKVVDTLLRAGADMEAGDGLVGTALHQAALKGNCAIMTQLMARGANVNALSSSGPVLNAAIRSGNVDAVNLITQSDVRFDIDYTTYESPLEVSAYYSEPALFGEILETAKDKWLNNEKLLDLALIRAASNPRAESVQILLKFPHTYTNSTIEEAILKAARENRWATVNILLDYVINDTREGNRRGVELGNVLYLTATCREDKVDLLDKIWAYGKANMSQDMCDFALYQAVILKKTATAIWLLETCRANPNITIEAMESSSLTYGSLLPGARFGTALNTAANSGDTDLVRVLLSKGAKLGEASDYALHLSSKEGHADVVRLLLDHGASVDREVEDDVELAFAHGTALQAACDNSKTAIVHMLLEHGADPNIGGGAFSNPLISATSKADDEILKLLLERPDIEINTFGGEVSTTPLINAAMHMSFEAVELLVEKGAEVNVQNGLGDTALIMAASRGDQRSVELLCRSGADITYKSPKRGLAIQAASTGSHHECAHILAEKMGGTIETYRERVKIDPSKAALQNALRRLRERDENVEKLSGVLAETEEQLEVARKEIIEARSETQRVVASQALYGQTYESTTQANKAMRAERDELLKHMDALRGELSLNKDAVSHFQLQLQQEKETSAALRKRSGWTALQEEKQATLDLLASEREAAAAKSRVEEKEREELHAQMAATRKELDDVINELAWARKAVSAAKDETSHEQREKERIREQLSQEKKELQDQLDDSGRALAQVVAAVERNSTRKSSDRDMATSSASGQHNESNGGPNGQIASGASSPNAGSSQQIPRRSVPSSPSPQPARSPGGFFTAHGEHRPDGSFGGYRNARQYITRRTTVDSLYEDSDKAST